MNTSSASKGASGAQRVRTGNRSTEPRVGSSNLSGRASEAITETRRDVRLAERTAARIARLIQGNAHAIEAARRSVAS